jgi:hypothetical protein
VVCGQTCAVDIVDVSVLVCARARGHAIVGGEPGDLRMIDAVVTAVRR